MAFEARVIELERTSSVIRKELNNLRKQVESLKFIVQSEMHKVRNLLLKPKEQTESVSASVDCGQKQRQVHHPAKSSKETFPSANKSTTVLSALSEMAIGRIKTCFKEKNGTPRQPFLCSKAPGSLTVEVFNNPGHSLEGLEEYSHVWLLFVFHKNSQDAVKAKVRPPRLNGKRIGVFASRSPHRPCPLGLTLAKVERIDGGTLHVSGIDQVDGTPVLDVKPYIPQYDCPWNWKTDYGVEVTPQTPADRTVPESKPDVLDQTKWCVYSPPGHVTVASWLSEPPVNCLEVKFLPQAETQLNKFVCRKGHCTSVENTTCEVANTTSGKCDQPFASEGIDTTQDGETDLGNQKSSKSEDPFILESFVSIEEAREAIVEMLRQDPRSVYRRTKCTDQSYQVSIDNLNLSCKFVGDECIITDVRSKALWKNEHFTDT